jgi:hypothetical protein
MSDPEPRAQTLAGTRPALVGAVLGLAGSVGLVLLALSGGGRDPDPTSQMLGQVALAIAVVAPFVLSLAVARAAAHVRAGVWLGSGIVAVAVGILSFTLAVFIHIPAGILLIVGGAMAMGRARPGPAVAVMAVVLLVGVGSFFARSLTTESQCWKLVRTPSGTEWRQAEPADGPGLGLTLGPNEIEATCVSDTTTPVESATVFLAWAALAGTIIVIARRRVDPDNGSPARSMEVPA